MSPRAAATNKSRSASPPAHPRSDPESRARTTAASDLLSNDPPLSLIDRWIRRLDRSASARVLFYLVLPAGLILVVHLLSWSCGGLRTGGFSPQLATTVSVSVVFIGTIHYAQRTAGRALRRFAPALKTDPSDLARFHHGLTSVPTAAIAGAVVGGALLLAAVNLSDPTFYGMLSTGLCVRPVIVTFGWMNSILIVLASYIGIRDLLLIRRAHAAAPVINLFERGPLFAFSTLSSRLALITAVFTYAWILIFPTSLQNTVNAAYLLGVNVPLILIIFVYPLYGMHGRMVDEKERLLAESGRRIQRALEALHAAPERKPASADPHRQLTSMIEEEAYLRKIPTWPWEPGTLTAVVTAVLLPLVLVILQQVAARYFAG